VRCRRFATPNACQFTATTEVDNNTLDIYSIKNNYHVSDKGNRIQVKADMNNNNRVEWSWIQCS